MSMRINKIVTHLSSEDAYTIVEFIDQLRDTLMHSYGDEIRVMLQEASRKTSDVFDDDLSF